MMLTSFRRHYTTPVKNAIGRTDTQFRLTPIPETWLRVQTALVEGLRGLPVGSSLARLVAEHRGARNHRGLPPLRVEEILAWAEAHHRRTGQLPRRSSGPVVEARGEHWGAVEAALHQGHRGLPGGVTLHGLRQRYRQVPAES
jgi:hypothetical protein